MGRTMNDWRETRFPPQAGEEVLVLAEHYGRLAGSYYEVICRYDPETRDFIPIDGGPVPLHPRAWAPIPQVADFMMPRCEAA